MIIPDSGISEMVLCWHPERIWRALSACWQIEHWRLVEFLSGQCVSDSKGCLCKRKEKTMPTSKRYCVSFVGRDWTRSKMRCLYLSCVDTDTGNRNDILFLSWHNPVYGSSAHGILMRLKDLKVSQFRAMSRSFSSRSLQIYFCNS